MTKTICTHCNGSGHQYNNPLKAIRDECEQQGIRISFPDLICETDAAKLLGYASGDALRKQVSEGRNRIEFITRGNQRKYSLIKISDFLST